MLRHELESRTGQLEDWQWELAHWVYQNHPSIRDVDGKDQIAEIVAHGFDRTSPIQDMYREVSGPPIVRYAVEEMYSTYQVTHEGWCINAKPKSARDVYRAVLAAYTEQYPDLAARLEYFGDGGHQVLEDAAWPGGRIAVFYVRGGSEGYYVHVEVLTPDTHHCMMLIKTLAEGEPGRQWAEQTVAAISRIMNV